MPHLRRALLCCAVVAALASWNRAANAEPRLLAAGALAGTADRSGLPGKLENGVPATMLGGLGSAIDHLHGDIFLALPDRGPNAVAFNKGLDDTVSYIARFHTIRMVLSRAPAGSPLPFTLSPRLTKTTLLWSASPLVYGSGTQGGARIGPGAPAQNARSHFYFTGRSDNYDPARPSSDPADARLDPEGMRVSADGVHVFVSDEYGPFLYEFDRATGRRERVFSLPAEFAVATPGATGKAEIAANKSGRVPNRGMEGLALTPDGKTLVGIIQSAMLQDKAEAPALLRIVTVEIATGTTHQYAYRLESGFGVSEIVAMGGTRFVVDDRDSSGLGDGTSAKFKRLNLIDLAGATDITGMAPREALAHAVRSVPFADLVALLGRGGIPPEQVPSKIEGLARGDDVTVDGKRLHTLWVANDNDFVPDEAGPSRFFVLGYTDADLKM